jgi:AcrR family transcriptional regulator
MDAPETDVTDRVRLYQSDPRGRKRDGRSEEVLEAALRQFEEFGIRRSTMEDVARRVGSSRVTIYRRFASKEALVDAVIAREVGRFLDALDDAVTPFETTDERLIEGFAFTLDYARRHTLLERLLATEPQSILPHLTLEGSPIVGAARDFLAERLGREVEEGNLPPLEVDVVGELLVRLVLSFLLTPATAARLETPEDARRFARRYLTPIVRAVAE